MTPIDEIKSGTSLTVQVRGRRVRVRVAGAGTPLVLLHAFPLSSAQWQPQLQSPPPGVRLIAPDLRGFQAPDADAADAAPAALTVADHAADVFDLMDALELPTAGVCGVSMGGYIAFAMLRRAPERITRLIFANTRATPDTPEARAARDKTIAMVHREGAAAVAREMIPKLLGETTRRDRPAVVAAVRAMIEANTPDGIAAALEALKTRPDSRPLLPDITCDTTIVHGAEDMIISREDAEAMHAGIEGSQLVVLPRSGHLSNLETPLEFTRLLNLA